MMELLPNFMAKRPYDAAEHDLAGTVVRSRSPLHAVGTKVLGFIDAGTQPKSKQGSLCQYTIVPGDRLVTRPEGMSAVDAAGITLTAQTAHQALFKEAGLEEGMSVLVNGGSSSVGLFAIQIAKARGLKVWATASGKNEELVRSVGADHVGVLCIYPTLDLRLRAFTVC
jgi:NADPH:quinone reductase-like Zn-dependent oxidoreductase